MENQKVFDIKNLSVHYKDQCALKKVSLDIFAHKLTTLVGLSGCGKTSFLKVLNLLHELDPETKVQGEILFHGEDLFYKKRNRVAHRRKVGMVFQKPNPFPFSIKKNLELPLKELNQYSSKEIDYLIQEVLEQVGLWDDVKNNLKKSALKLSGGQQQRLCFARSLLLKPEVLLMDEPTSSLDPISAAKIESLINSLKDKITMVMVTHNLAQARRLADYVAYFGMHHPISSLIEFEEAQKFFHKPLQPETQNFLQSELMGS